MHRKYGGSVRNRMLLFLILGFMILSGIKASARLGFMNQMRAPAPVFDWDFTLSSAAIPSVLTLTRASAANYFNSSGVMTSAASNAARFDYNPATLASRGLLLEPAATNLILQSQAFDNASWSKTGLTVTANSAGTTAPDGTTTSELFTETTANSVHAVTQNIAHTANVTVTMSIYAKASGSTFIRVGGQETTAFTDSISVICDTSTRNTTTMTNGTGTITSTSCTQAANGWVRLSVTGIVSTARSGLQVFANTMSALNTTVSYVGSTARSVYYWGLQVEDSPTATSYIATTTATASRSADQLVSNTFSWFNSSRGTLYAKYVNVGPNNGASYIAAGVFATNAAGTYLQNAAFIGDQGTTNTSAVRAGNVAQFIPSATLNAAGSVNKVAISFASNNFAFSANGAAATTASSGSFPVTPAYLYIGSQPDGSMRPRWIQQIRYYNMLYPSWALPQLTQ